MVFKKKQQPKKIEFNEEDYEGDLDEEEELEEEELEEEEETPKKVKKKPTTKPTLQDILLSHEQRIQALESWAFRVKSQ